MEKVMRTYRHLACGGVTEVSGGALRALSTPLLPPSLTECAACKKTDVVDQFVWTHTEEPLPAALSRIRRGLPLPLRLLSSRSAAGMSLLLGVVAGVAVGVLDRWWVGALVGFGVMIVLAGIVTGGGKLLAGVYGIDFESRL